jgi:hypothetical protein
MRRWKCTNPDCEMNKQGLIRFTDQPAHARVVCEKCGSLMNTVAGDDQIVFVGDYPPTLLSAGTLEVARPKVGICAAAFGRKATPTITDPDIAQYPSLEDARHDPQILRPDLYSYLQTSDLFLVRKGEHPATAVVARCPSHHLKTPLTPSLPVGIHIEIHQVEKWELFAIYPLVWDNPREPWFAEHTECPYDLVGANEEELSNPIVHGYSWRKLFYLLSQIETELLFLDESNRLVCMRTANFRTGQARAFEGLLRRLEGSSGKQISKPDLFKLHSLHNRAVDIREVQRRFPSM